MQTQNRRGFFKGLAAIAGGLSGAAVIASAEPKLIPGNYILENALITLQEAVDYVASYVNEQVQPLVHFGDYTPSDAFVGTTINYPIPQGNRLGNKQVSLEHHYESGISSRSFRRLCDHDTSENWLEPAAIALSESIKAKLWRSHSRSLAVRRLPASIEGTGAISKFSQGPGVVVRGIMSYNPSTLDQTISFDVLFGVA